MQHYPDTKQCALYELTAIKLEIKSKTMKHKMKLRILFVKFAKFNVKCQIDDYVDLIIGLLATVPLKEYCGRLM